MNEEERDRDEQTPRKPRVVDKRISARAAAGDAAQESPPQETEPQEAPEPPPPPQEPAVAEPAAPQAPAAGEPPAVSAEGRGDRPRADGDQKVWTPQQEAEAARMAQEIAETPSFEWVVNTAVTLANVAATKLELGAGGDAQLAIDALAGILTSVGSRLEQAESPLRQTLAQLQLAYAERLTNPPSP
jgi:hypothetical protein